MRARGKFSRSKINTGMGKEGDYEKKKKKNVNENKFCKKITLKTHK